MKKLLLLILNGLLLVLCMFIVIEGFEVGNIQVLSYIGITEQNKRLDERIQESSKLVEKDYKQAISTIQESSKKLEQAKKDYEDMTMISSDGDVQNASQIERYSLESLWVKLGNHATSEGIVLKMDIVKGSNNAEDYYDLQFTATGKYISIIDFISDIENDSTLGFKIEEFKMLPSGSQLQATFTCRDIGIKEVLATTPTTNTTQTENSTKTTNTTNTASGTNTNSTGNTANTTNTTNTANTAR